MSIGREMIERLRKLANVGFGYEITPEDREALNAAVSALDPQERDRASEGYVKVIDVEKALCARLGKEWTPTGISILTLIDMLANTEGK